MMPERRGVDYRAGARISLAALKMVVGAHESDAASHPGARERLQGAACSGSSFRYLPNLGLYST